MLFVLISGRNAFAANDNHSSDQQQNSPQSFPKPTLSDLLGGMGAALNSGNYAMSLVFIHDGQIDSLRYSHLTTAENRYDKLEHLQGSQRMIISQNGDSFLVMGKEKIHLKKEDGTPVDRWKNQLRRLAKNIKNYRVSISGLSRIAGRLAFELNFIAIDDSRYSTRLWLDSLSYLPLRIDALNNKGKVIEQMLAIDLQYPANLTDASFFIDENLTSLVEPPVVENASNQDSYWKIGWLPSGYELASYHKNKTHKHQQTEQWVFSDGLTSLSVFIESQLDLGANDKSNRSKNTFIRGDTLIYDLKSGPINFTVIGDIPPKVAEKIATSIQPKSEVKTESDIHGNQ